MGGRKGVWVVGRRVWVVGREVWVIGSVGGRECEW